MLCKVKIDGNHPIKLDNNEILQQKLDYVHFNPVESEIEDNPDGYKCSSAKEFAGVRKGLLAVELLDELAYSHAFCFATRARSKYT
ncbi:hypothetical protein QYS49_05565 [Marivirga salinae]|uniref:Transposase n=1 Tax=Marivirga salinarum TaxID=3059078 RepID=A0AA49GCS1_9BACT|nr:hypothetical protein [Marivirga sp. BDSF4-3]WKK76749.1 hypothetical protein QYS49_05565 [Marivirga sp. BDSF4-3]